MKSPVPFLKPKSYYASPIKSSVTKDEIVVQCDPIQHIVEDIVVPEEPVIVNKPLVENIPLIEQSKLKKHKHNKPSEPEL
jgi:hypothetical protein